MSWKQISQEEFHLAFYAGKKCGISHVTVDRNDDEQSRWNIGKLTRRFSARTVSSLQNRQSKDKSAIGLTNVVTLFCLLVPRG
jgi:hypothetical protein